MMQHLLVLRAAGDLTLSATQINGRSAALDASTEVISLCDRSPTTLEQTIRLKADSMTPPTIQGPTATPRGAGGAGAGTGGTMSVTLWAMCGVTSVATTVNAKTAGLFFMVASLIGQAG